MGYSLHLRGGREKKNPRELRCSEYYQGEPQRLNENLPTCHNRLLLTEDPVVEERGGKTPPKTPLEEGK